MDTSPKDQLIPKKVDFSEVRKIAKEGEKIVEKEAKEQWQQEIRKAITQNDPQQ